MRQKELILVTFLVSHLANLVSRWLQGISSLVLATGQWAVSSHSPHTLTSAGCSRREGLAESQGLEGPSGVSAHSDLWKLLGTELQPGAVTPRVRAAPTLASSVMGPAWPGVSTQRLLKRGTSALGCWEQPPVCYFSIYFSWLFHFLGSSKVVYSYFFFINFAPVSFSQAHLFSEKFSKIWNDTYSGKMVISDLCHAHLIHSSRLPGHDTRALDMKLKNKHSPKMKVTRRGDNYFKAKIHCSCD